MSNGVKFLGVVETYGGYCQICNEARFVGRIAVAGWPYHGSVCARCLGEMADEVHRRATALGAGQGGHGAAPAGTMAGGPAPGAAGVRGNGSHLLVGAPGNGTGR